MINAKTLLQDRIVLGIRDSTIQKDILKTSSLDLKKTIKICKASENAMFQNQDMKKEVSVNKIRPNLKGKNQMNLRECRYCGNKHVR